MKQSAGILVYKRAGSDIKVLLAHPGGPFWSNKDTWSIPKGELNDGEDLLTAAQREFEEEMGFAPPAGEWLDLGESKQNGSKVNYIWAIEGDPDISRFNCASTFEIEWPPKSGKTEKFPENDRIAWFGLAAGRSKVFKAQQLFFDCLAEKLSVDSGATSQQSLF